MAHSAPDDPEQQEGGIEARAWPGARLKPLPVERPERREHREAHQQPQLRLKPLGAEQALQRARPFPGQGDEHPLEDALALEMAHQGRAVDALLQVPLQQPVQENAADQRDHAHEQGLVEAVPDREAVVGRIRPQDRAHRRGEEGLDGHRRDDADEQARQDQELDGKAHPVRRLVRRARQVRRGRAEEHAVDEPQRIGDAEGARQHGEVGQGMVEHRVDVEGRPPRRRTSPSTGSR